MPLSPVLNPSLDGRATEFVFVKARKRLALELPRVRVISDKARPAIGYKHRWQRQRARSTRALLEGLCALSILLTALGVDTFSILTLQMGKLKAERLWGLRAAEQLVRVQIQVGGSRSEL